MITSKGFQKRLTPYFYTALCVVLAFIAWDASGRFFDPKNQIAALLISEMCIFYVGGAIGLWVWAEPIETSSAPSDGRRGRRP